MSGDWNITIPYATGDTIDIQKELFIKNYSCSFYQYMKLSYCVYQEANQSNNVWMSVLKFSNVKNW